MCIESVKIISLYSKLKGVTQGVILNYFSCNDVWKLATHFRLTVPFLGHFGKGGRTKVPTTASNLMK